MHEEYPDNTCVVIENMTDGVDEAFAKADVVVKQAFRNQRLIPGADRAPGRGRPVDPSSDELTVYTSTQIPHFVRTFLAICCNVSEAKVRVVAPDVGGGFGSKLNCYAEEFIARGGLAQAGRPGEVDRGAIRVDDGHHPRPRAGRAHGARRRPGRARSSACAPTTCRTAGPTCSC